MSDFVSQEDRREIERTSFCRRCARHKARADFAWRLILVFFFCQVAFVVGALLYACLCQP